MRRLLLLPIILLALAILAPPAHAAGGSLFAPVFLTPPEAEAVVNYVHAVEVQQVADYIVSQQFPSDAWWYRIGRCEQPGNGYQSVDWTIHGPGYQGGLGISSAAWSQNRDATMPYNGGDATPAQQLAVARRIFAYAGAHAWGCSPVAGAPY